MNCSNCYWCRERNEIDHCFVYTGPVPLNDDTYKMIKGKQINPHGDCQFYDEKQQKISLIVIKNRITSFMIRNESVLFDDLERSIPEIKDDSNLEKVHYLTLSEPYNNIAIWAMSELGVNGISELLNEGFLELHPQSNWFGVSSYLAGTESFNPVQNLPIMKKKYPYKKLHWCPCSLNLIKK